MGRAWGWDAKEVGGAAVVLWAGLAWVVARRGGRAGLAVGVQSNPEPVWDVICQHGISEDEDMRAGVATVLLEHLLEYHFDAYFPRLKERIEGGSALLADTLSRCWPFGQAVPRWPEVRALAGRAG